MADTLKSLNSTFFTKFGCGVSREREKKGVAEEIETDVSVTEQRGTCCNNRLSTAIFRSVLESSYSIEFCDYAQPNCLVK